MLALTTKEQNKVPYAIFFLAIVSAPVLYRAANDRRIAQSKTLSSGYKQNLCQPRKFARRFIEPSEIKHLYQDSRFVTTSSISQMIWHLQPS